MPVTRRTQLLVLLIGLGVVAGLPPTGAQQASTSLSPAALAEIAQVEAAIDQIEEATLTRLASPPDNQVQQVELVGKLMLYDKNLSVNRNEACAFCHMPETGFTGPVSELNRTTGSYPGSVRTRFSQRRKPQSHAYAPLSPVLHYNPGKGDLVGGNFWDMRATGRRLGNPAAEQAEGPPTNPVEMGLPDLACAVYRASERPYRQLFERVWGAQAFAIAWPSNVDEVCNTPGPAPAADPLPVHLTDLDRGRAVATFDQMAQSIAGYEASAEVTSFTSRYDAVLAGKTQFTAQEQQGYDLFRGKAQCNNCHRDGGPGEDPLFTDFTASNIGTPANPMLPFYAEGQRDAQGYGPIRPANHSLTLGWEIFSPVVTNSAARHPWTHAGCPWSVTTMGDFRSRPCAMWISAPTPASSRPMATTGISRASSRSCISTTRATRSRAARRMIAARVRPAGRHRNRPTTSTPSALAASASATPRRTRWSRSCKR